MRRLLPILVVALLVAGCGDAPERDAEAIAGDAAAALERARQYRLEVRIREDGAEAGRCEGVVDHDRTRSHYRCTFRGDDVELIAIGSDQYARGSTYGLRAGWVKFPTDEPVGGDFPDPRELLAILRRGAISTENLGPEKVRGVETTRYRFVADLRDTSLGADDARTTLELWIDDDDLIRRLRGVEPEGTYEMDFFAFGEPVEVEPPPAAEVRDLDDLAASNPPEPCAGGATAPVTKAELVAALSAADVDVEPLPHGCLGSVPEDAVVALSDVTEGTAPEREWVQCGLARSGRGETVREDRVREQVVRLDLANASCALFWFEGPVPRARLEQLREAFAMLRADLS
jgi:hypothetical protein